VDFPRLRSDLAQGQPQKPLQTIFTVMANLVSIALVSENAAVIYWYIVTARIRSFCHSFISIEIVSLINNPRKTKYNLRGDTASFKICRVDLRETRFGKFNAFNSAMNS
jgi:hypothetical protein